MNTPDNRSGGYALAKDVYSWPEFRALCERLGITMNVPTRALTIHVPVGGAVVVTHEYFGRTPPVPG